MVLDDDVRQPGEDAADVRPPPRGGLTARRAAAAAS
jgi:hypothetical protein